MGEKLFIFTIAVVLGAVLGSAADCLTMRLIRHESFDKGRSHCEFCGHVLGLQDLMPILSFLLLKGHCRYCGQKLSWHMLISEIVGIFIVLPTIGLFGISVKSVMAILMLFLLWCISLCDWQEGIIPNALIFFGIITNLGYCLWSASEFWVIFRCLARGMGIALPVLGLVLIMDFLLKQPSMGGGDLKLIFMLGMTTSLLRSLAALLLACFSSLLLCRICRKKSKEAFPFGPELCFGWVVIWLVNGFSQDCFLWQ